MTYTKAVEYLLRIPKFSKIKTKPEDLKVYLSTLGNPERDQTILHVAGTNGKGSVCAFLTSILMEAEKRVGTFTSPHLIDINERIAINRSPIEENAFVAAFQKVLETVNQLTQLGYHHPTYFEFLFLMGMVAFCEQSLDYIILETGLGGRLDATNVIEKPLVSIITSISLDHVAVLGNTITAIAGEKAGIIKSKVPLVYDATDPQAAKVMMDKARQMNTISYRVDRDCYHICEITDSKIDFFGNTRRFGKQMFTIPFIADYQVENAMLAVTALEVIDSKGKLSLDEIQRGLAKTVWSGRMEQVMEGVYLDGAHNIGGIIEFVRTANRVALKRKGKLYLLFAVVSDKDYKTMIDHICQNIAFESVIVTSVDNQRTLKLETLKDSFLQAAYKKVYQYSMVEEAIEAALKLKQPEDTLFCVGSLYLVGSIKGVLRRKCHD